MSWLRIACSSLRCLGSTADWCCLRYCSSTSRRTRSLYIWLVSAIGTFDRDWERCALDVMTWRLLRLVGWVVRCGCVMGVTCRHQPRNSKYDVALPTPRKWYGGLERYFDDSLIANTVKVMPEWIWPFWSSKQLLVDDFYRKHSTNDAIHTSSCSVARNVRRT